MKFVTEDISVQYTGSRKGAVESKDLGVNENDGSEGTMFSIKTPEFENEKSGFYAEKQFPRLFFNNGTDSLSRRRRGRNRVFGTMDKRDDDRDRKSRPNSFILKKSKAKKR